MKRTVIVVLLLVVVFAGALGGGRAAAQGPQPPHAAQASLGTAFTYQGELKKNGTPVTTSCNLQFTLFADAGGTVTVAGPVSGSPDPVTPTNGRFTVQVDFGAGQFDGSSRWLGVAAKCAGDSAFTPMSALQPLTPAPYALYSATAGSVNYQNVVVVAKSGGNFATITDALNSITTASYSNRFLVKVMPGVYTETVTMKPYVDIEGSGELTTKITQVGSGSSSTGTVVGANNAELRFLTVANTGGATYAVAIYNSSASPRLTHITASASGGGDSVGVSNSHSSPTMTDVTVTALGDTGGYGIQNDSSSPTMTDMTVTASGGTNSFGVLNFLHSSPTMTNVTATASGGTTNRGVTNDTASSPRMTNVTATASGPSGSINYAVNNRSSSSPTMTYLVASASGGSNNYSVYNESSSVTIQNSTISAKDGNSDGIVNTGGSDPYTVIVNNSVISAATSTIYNSSNNYTVKVGASQLIGIGGQGLGTYICAFSYNGDYLPLNSGTCKYP